MRSLLPKNATDFERSLEAMQERIELLPIPIRAIWSTEDCPEKLLPWLAHAVGVERWQDDYTEAQKRAAIEASLLIHQKEGTLAAVKRVLAIEGFGFEVVENSHGPFTFSLDISSLTTMDRAARESITRAAQAVMTAKNTRSHLKTVSVAHVVESTVGMGMSVAIHRPISVLFDMIQSHPDPICARLGATTHTTKEVDYELCS